MLSLIASFPFECHVAAAFDKAIAARVEQDAVHENQERRERQNNAETKGRRKRGRRAGEHVIDRGVDKSVDGTGEK